MKKYRKKPIVVEAIQWLYNTTEVAKKNIVFYDMIGYHVITIHGQKAYLKSGDWIIIEPDGKHCYPCKPDIFEATFEEVVEE